MTGYQYCKGRESATELRATSSGLVLLLVASLMLSGCAMFESNVDFSSAKRAKQLEVPPELVAPAHDDRFAVPDGASGSTTFSAYEKNRLTGGDKAANEAVVVMPAIQSEARIERAGSQRWLVMQGGPDKVWVKLKEFWESMGYPLSLDMPAIGIMETDWHEEKAPLQGTGIRGLFDRLLDTFSSKPERDKYRARLEAGATPDTTEVYISHRQMYEAFVDEGRSETAWQPQPSKPEYEAEMLRRFVVFVGVEEKAAKQMLAAVPQAPERSRVLEQDGRAVLEINDRFDRSWRRVGLALDRVGFTVEDRNRSEGVYYVRYVDSDAAALRESKEGFFSWMAFWRDKPPPPPTQFAIDVKGVSDKDKTQVSVRTREGGADDPATGRKIVGLLNEQLK